MGAVRPGVFIKKVEMMEFINQLIYFQERALFWTLQTLRHTWNQGCGDHYISVFTLLG